MKKILVQTIVALTLVFAGCASPVDGPVEIRVVNETNTEVKTLVVSFDDEVALGDLAPGQVSAYRVVGEAYRYAGARFIGGQTPYQASVIDYVGEKPLAGGKYDYALRIDRGIPNLWIKRK